MKKLQSRWGPGLAAADAADYTSEAHDGCLMAEAVLPYGGESARAKVIARKRDSEGNPIGKAHPKSPMLDTRLYEVELPDGSTKAVAANLITENLHSQIDAEGCSCAVIKEIVDHHTNSHALSKDDGFIEMPNGTHKPKRTTRGWEHLCELGDGATAWTPLKDLKESIPVEVAEYAIANKIAEEPAFAWWVHDVLRRRDHIISKVKSRYWKHTHKYGVELPKMVK